MDKIWSILNVLTIFMNFVENFISHVYYNSWKIWFLLLGGNHMSFMLFLSFEFLDLLTLTKEDIFAAISFFLLWIIFNLLKKGCGEVYSRASTIGKTLLIFGGTIVLLIIVVFLITIYLFLQK